MTDIIEEDEVPIVKLTYDFKCKENYTCT